MPAGLFSGDVAQRTPQKVFVTKFDSRDQRERGGARILVGRAARPGQPQTRQNQRRLARILEMPCLTHSKYVGCARSFSCAAGLRLVPGCVCGFRQNRYRCFLCCQHEALVIFSRCCDWIQPVGAGNLACRNIDSESGRSIPVPFVPTISARGRISAAGAGKSRSEKNW